MNILIVDDSIVFRSQIKKALEGISGMDVVGTVSNGKLAIEKLQQLPVDLVILDQQMPEMDGLQTLKEMKKRELKPKVIMYSSLTTTGSQLTLDALANGAHDFITKPSGGALTFDTAQKAIREGLVVKISQFIDKSMTPTIPQKRPEVGVLPSKDFLKVDLQIMRPEIIVIGSSTGGPPALEKVLDKISVTPKVPILIAQHMPPIFTHSLAKRIEKETGAVCNEAVDNEKLQNNRIYVAPGDYHMTLEKKMDGHVYIRLDQTPHQNSVRPAVDPLFKTAAEIYKNHCLGIILTGMGEDGVRGCNEVKKHGGGVMIQNKESCVVFGMPGAVMQAGCYDEIGDLMKINNLIRSKT